MKTSRRGFFSKAFNYSKLSFAVSFAPISLWINLFTEKVQAQFLKHGAWRNKSVVGTLWAWGRNTEGQLGQNHASNRSSPVLVGNERLWAEVSAGFEHTLAVRTNGTLFAFGTGSWNVLGDNVFSYGNGTTRSSPVQIGALTNWSKVSAGRNHSMSIKTDGTLWGWGRSVEGMVGVPVTNDAITYISPVQVGALTSWAKVSAGGYHSAAIKTDGTIWSWGANNSGQLGFNPPNTPTPTALSGSWADFSAGGGFVIAKKTTGALWSWGRNIYDQDGVLGDGTGVSKSSPVQIGTLTDWSKINSGSAHTLAIKTNGTLWAWGANNAGQIGNGESGFGRYKSPIQIGTATNWQSVSAGDERFYTFSLAIKTDGTLWSWGNNDSGQLAAPTSNSPVQIGSLTNWSVIDINLTHSLAVKTDGTLWAWGGNKDNWNGALGDGTSIHRSSPVQIGALTTWSKVSAGAGSSLAIKTNGTLWSWGRNNSGQLGNGNTTWSVSPVQVGTDTTWTSIKTAGDYYGSYGHAAGIKTNASLWLWGNNSAGQLGDGTTTSCSSPVQLGTTDWAFVDGSYRHTIAIKTNGTLWTWGENTDGQLGDGTTTSKSSPVQVGALTNWSKIATSRRHAVAIKTDGTLWAWGSNGSGELGDGTNVNKSSPMQIGAGTNWVHVKCGGVEGPSYTTAIKSDGTIWSWGDGNSGRLGIGLSTGNRSSPVQIGALTNWSKLSIGEGTSVAIKTDGTIWSWGGNGMGALGLGDAYNTTIPNQVGALTNWSKLCAGVRTSFAIKTDGTLWGWGNADDGRLGDGTTVTKSSPVQIGAGTNWAEISNIDNHTLAVKTDGTLWAWGIDYDGKLGINVAFSSRSSPVQVGTLTNWSKVSASYEYSVALKTDGTIWAWGKNNVGQLGNGTNITYSSPIQIGTDTTWIKIETSSSSTTALKSDGSIWAFGENGEGQLGFTPPNSPVQIGALTNWSKVSTGDACTAAVKTDGTLWAWGSNGNGELGDGTTATKSSPVQIGALTNWSDVSVKNSHTIAVKTDGTLWAWGNNGSGQLGDGTTVYKSSPIQVGALTTWSKVTAGYDHSVATKTDGTVWAWGRNNDGELADGTTINKSSPVQIGVFKNWVKISAGKHTLAIK